MYNKIYLYKCLKISIHYPETQHYEMLVIAHNKDEAELFCSKNDTEAESLWEAEHYQGELCFIPNNVPFLIIKS